MSLLCRCLHSQHLLEDPDHQSWRKHYHLALESPGRQIKKSRMKGFHNYVVHQAIELAFSLQRLLCETTSLIMLTCDSHSLLSWSSNSLFLCLSFSTESLCVCSIFSLSSALSLSCSRVLLVLFSLMFSLRSFFSLAFSRVLSSDSPYTRTVCVCVCVCVCARSTDKTNQLGNFKDIKLKYKQAFEES